MPGQSAESIKRAEQGRPHSTRLFKPLDHVYCVRKPWPNLLLVKIYSSQLSLGEVCLEEGEQFNAEEIIRKKFADY